MINYIIQVYTTLYILEDFLKIMGDKLYTFSFKEGFKRARKKSGHTQKSFSEKFNISIETVRNWEQGRNVPEIETLEKLCNFFHCNADYLLGNIDCETHDNQFIHNEIGLSEKAIKELRYLTLLDSTLATEPDLNTINTLLEQLSSQYNNIIHIITEYLHSSGLSKDIWYDIRNEQLSEKKPLMATNRIHIPAHSDIFDNLLLIDIQKRIINLKNELKKINTD